MASRSMKIFPILTDGQTFTYVCFQLNTLDFRKESDDSGVNNVFWTGPSLKLYESIQEGKGVEGFDDTCAGLLMKFLLNRLIRPRPKQWGVGSRTMPTGKLVVEGQQLSA